MSTVPSRKLSLSMVTSEHTKALVGKLTPAQLSKLEALVQQKLRQMTSIDQRGKLWQQEKMRKVEEAREAQYAK